MTRALRVATELVGCGRHLRKRVLPSPPCSLDSFIADADECRHDGSRDVSYFKVPHAGTSENPGIFEFFKPINLYFKVLEVPT